MTTYRKNVKPAKILKSTYDRKAKKIPRTIPEEEYGCNHIRRSRCYKIDGKRVCHVCFHKYYTDIMEYD